jgi:hypothetical protein
VFKTWVVWAMGDRGLLVRVAAMFAVQAGVAVGLVLLWG